jgi:hypothetical protein
VVTTITQRHLHKPNSWRAHHRRLVVRPQHHREHNEDEHGGKNEDGEQAGPDVVGHWEGGA